MRILVVILVMFCAGCASYITPGGPMALDQISGDGTAAVSSQPSPNLPANVAVVRVQAPQYKSHSTAGQGAGRFTVVTAQEPLSEQQLQDLAKWPEVSRIATVNPLLLPATLDSLDDVRLAAAKLQADILLVYTVDTVFRVQGRAYGPLVEIPLGEVPDSNAAISSTASAVFMDVRTGYSYGAAFDTAEVSGLAEAWGSPDRIDQKRLQAEQQASKRLLAKVEKTWAEIADRYR